MYYLLLDCCKNHFKNLTHLFSHKCHDDFMNRDYLEFGESQFNKRLAIKIPTLFRDEYGRICAPEVGDEYDQYALLDLIEFIAQNAKDISEGWNNQRYQNFWNIVCLETTNIFNDYQHEINGLFDEAGLLYTLTAEKIVERVVENGVLSPEVETVINNISEPGTKALMAEAIYLFKHPKPGARNDAVEKLWDAFERLKTYYTSLDKKASAAKIVKDMSNGQTEFEQLFDGEFAVLTKVGNDYRIRHHETNKIEIKDIRHYDYFFNRCLALIAAASQYLH